MCHKYVCVIVTFIHMQYFAIVTSRFDEIK